MKRYEYLDSLRGIAILGVVLTHAGLAVEGLPQGLESFSRSGLRGVQLFFMVSALTLCLVSKPDSLDLRRFYLRRFFRIAPMFYAAAMFYALARGLLDISFAPVPVTLLDAVTTVLFVHGFNPHGINNVVPGGWSIASEAIFYALFPLVLVHARSVRLWLGIVAVSFAIALANAAIPRVMGIEDPMWRDFFHFNFLTNLPSFATGVLIFTILRKTGASASNGRWRVAALAAIIAAIVTLGAMGSAIPGDQLLMIPILGTLTWMAAVTEPRLIVNRPLSLLGELSFSIYLLHFIVLHYVDALVPQDLAPIARLGMLYGATVVISALLAWGTYRFIERPGIRIGHRLSEQFGRSRQAPATAEFGVGPT
ncbi:acyltransferase family protein [Novosphingobium aquimarinum]|uniref:acyltransferase family protein n=1 Tax=Novosphingobium aquimarinum TaxID=2682494 RepID=UPI0012EB7AA9|nr:acyltransferase [Novosphingobium aquimarinum]